MPDYRISLAAARINAKMTQEQVAAALRTSKTSVVNWENGKTTPNYATLCMLCELYRAPINAIILPNEST